MLRKTTEARILSHGRSGGGGASSRAADMVVKEITNNGELEHEPKPLTFAPVGVSIWILHDSVVILKLLLCLNSVTGSGSSRALL